MRALVLATCGLALAGCVDAKETAPIEAAPVPLQSTEPSVTAASPDRCVIAFNDMTLEVPALSSDCRLSLDGSGDVRIENHSGGDGEVLVAGTSTVLNTDGDCETRLVGILLADNEVVAAERVLRVSSCAMDDLDLNVFTSWDFDQD